LEVTTKLNEQGSEILELLEDKILFNNSQYAKIFKQNLTDKGGVKTSKRNCVIKIRAKNNKTYIYRLFFGGNNFGIKKEQAFLTFTSLNELGLVVKKDSEEIIVTEGCKLLFFWFHPNFSTRVTFKFAFFSLLVGLISIVFAIIPFFK